MSGSYAQRYLHALHMLHQEKEKQQRKVEENRRKLDKIRAKLKVNLDAFLEGKQAKVSVLSREFLKQAVVVDDEKKKLDSLQSKLISTKATFSTAALRGR